MPGAMRSGERQRLVSGPCGKASWSEWWDWMQETTDGLPDPENLASEWDDMPELAPPLIDGVLRQGHKMLLAGPSKAGKSFALIELCVSLAEGKPWFGWECAQGRVLYVNLELDSASCLHRFKDVYGALGYAPKNVGNIDIWNLRGRSVPMDRLAPSLIRRALKTRPIAVVIDRSTRSSRETRTAQTRWPRSATSSTRSPSRSAAPSSTATTIPRACRDRNAPWTARPARACSRETRTHCWT